MLPLLGLPITIERTYDSRDPSPGDFGAGWRLDLQTTKLRLGRPLGTDWTQEATHATFPRSFCLGLDPLRTVTITLPDGRQEVFDLVPTTAEGARHSPTFGKLPPQCQWLVPIEFATAVYQPRPGTVSTLEALADKELIVVGGPGEDALLFSLATLDVYAPTRFRLTTPEGLVLVLAQDRGVEQLTDPNGNTLTFGPEGLQHSAGTSVVFTRDGQGRITRITNPVGQTLAWTYNAQQQPLSATDAQGYQYRYAYESDGRLRTITDPAGQVTTYTSNAQGQPVTRTDALGHTLRHRYDPAGRRIETINALGSAMAWSYDAHGNRLTETTTRANPPGQPLSLTTHWVYDRRNRPIAQIDPLGFQTSTEYNALGQEAAEIDKQGQRTTYEYDARGHLVRTRYADGTEETATYDAAGNRVSWTDRANRTTTYTYDALNRLVQTTFPDGSRTSTRYDAAGQAVTDANGQRTDYGFDAAGRRTTISDALGQTTFAYDARNNLVRVYEAGGQRVQVSRPNGTRTQATYDARQRLTQLVHQHADGRTLASVTYTLDAVGNPVQSVEHTGKTVTYAYDALGRLVEEAVSDPPNRDILAGLYV